MTARAMVLVAVVLQVALTPALSAQDAAGFAGEWIATKDTKGITSVKIVDAPSGRTVQAFAACTPRPCDWGIVPFTVLEQRPKGSGPAVGFATWRRGTATRVMSCTTEEYTRPAVRPPYSVLGTERDYPIVLPDWQDGLASYLRERAPIV